MKKNIIMKKSTFLTGTFITTIGIVLSKVLGALYVVPFHAIIGEKGGALYGYAYTIYNGLLSLSTAGIPLAVSKVVSEYKALGFQKAKAQTLVLGKRIAVILGVSCFAFVFFFAPFLAKIILGDVVGGNTVQDITFVIRVIGIAILIVPLLSVYRGYFEGHRFFGPSSISQVLEQFIRVLVIIFGSFLFLKVFHFALTNCVAVALFGATVGALCSYAYLFLKKLKNEKKFQASYYSVNEPIIVNKVIIKKIFYYAIPFVFIDLFKSFYGYTDMVTLVKFLVKKASFSPGDAETIYSIFSTWAQKFNMIILAISSGIIVSLIPNLTECMVKEERKQIHKKIIQGLNILLYLTIPLTLGISFLAKPIWILFYENSVYGSNILSYYIFIGLFVGLFSFVVVVLQTLKDFKAVFFSLSVGVLLKVFFNNKFLLAFVHMRFPAYYGAITATIIGYFVSFIICLIIFQKKYFISFEPVIKNFIDVMCCSIFMVVCLVVVKFFLPFYSKVRVHNVWIIIIYGIVGMLAYFGSSTLCGLTEKVFGKKVLNRIRKKIFLKKLS